MNRPVVYTAIFGDSDDLKTPIIVNHDVDYVCYTDNLNTKSDIWEIRRFYDPAMRNRPRETARRFAILSHLHFSCAPWTFYIDGSVLLKCDPVALAKLYLAEKPLWIFRHPHYKDIRNEVAAMVRRYELDEDATAAKFARYIGEGFDPETIKENYLSGILLRSNCTEVSRFNELWFKEYMKTTNFFGQDEIPFNYLLWKTGIDYGVFPGKPYHGSEICTVHKHKKRLL